MQKSIVGVNVDNVVNKVSSIMLECYSDDKMRIKLEDSIYAKLLPWTLISIFTGEDATDIPADTKLNIGFMVMTEDDVDEANSTMITRVVDFNGDISAIEADGGLKDIRESIVIIDGASTYKTYDIDHPEGIDINGGFFIPCDAVFAAELKKVQEAGKFACLITHRKYDEELTDAIYDVCDHMIRLDVG